MATIADPAIRGAITIAETIIELFSKLLPCLA
jgi:hypothetical protein